MFADSPVSSQFIAGEWREGHSDRTVEVRNPYDDTVVTTIRLADAGDLDAAYSAARQAQRGWAATGPAARRKVMLAAAEILRARRSEIVDWLVRESGSTVLKAHIEVSLAVTMTQEAASFPTRMVGHLFDTNTPEREVRVERKAVGVVGIISPWNFPLHLTQRSLAPALALGNAVVIKPASDTPVTGGLLLARIFEEAGLPAGVLNVVVGAGTDIGDEFVAHPVPGLISFTGSTPVGKRVGRVAISGEHLKSVALELGGNAPFVVLADADLDAAVHAAIGGSFLHSGQICMAINRIIVEEPIREAFLSKFLAAARKVAVGDPADKRTLVGPIINDSQVESLRAKIVRAREEGATVELEGEIHGRVIPPHIFSDVTPDMEIAREEIFGPLVGVLSARDEDLALELANRGTFGLSASVFTRDLDRGLRFARRMESGMAFVNEGPIQDEAHVAFGGTRNSGLGRFNGEWAIDAFTTTQTLGVVRIGESPQVV
ncbi:aldehyde dehydrogenase family protein [Corynebacterium nasicanis]|uniref:Aldehyde dehydrogenase family protein n=1 Tax=Corynebacterium nasicanis TaxID=1448267 RepID=A0ABW1QBE4_9CORY